MRGVNAQWAMGDYLINYAGGFVRRGLAGSLILHAANLTRLSPFLLVFLLQAVVYLTFLIATYRLTLGLRWTYAFAALVLCPATLSFMFFAPGESLRKEILLYALLALLCQPKLARWRPWQIAAALTLLVPALVLTHELTALYLPYVAAAIFLQLGTDVRRTAAVLALPTLATLAALAAVVLHPGNPAIAQAVCTAIGGGAVHPYSVGDYGICNGAITWLTWSFQDGRTFTSTFIHTDRYLSFYSLRLPLIFAPHLWLLFTYWRRPATHRAAVALAVAAILSAIASSVLFITATDWGRWLSIHAVCLMLLLLLIARPHPEATRLQPTARLFSLPALLIAIYAVTWSLPAMFPPIRNSGGLPGLYAYHRKSAAIPTP